MEQSLGINKFQSNAIMIEVGRGLTNIMTTIKILGLVVNDIGA